MTDERLGILVELVGGNYIYLYVNRTDRIAVPRLTFLLGLELWCSS
jgi:hypothetical protein